MRCAIGTLLLIIYFPLLSAQISMPKVFSNHMVLQRNLKIPLWGRADAGNQIQIEIAGTRTTTIAGTDGKWKAHLPSLKAGGPYTLTIYTADLPEIKTEFHDIMIGDVWLASGQSNMEWQVKQSKDAQSEISTANYPEIRFFNVPHEKSLLPQDNLKSGSWVICDSMNVKNASAVAYFFARKIHIDEKVPVGILQSTWGGTPVETWTSREMLLTSEITASRVLNNDSLCPHDFIKDSLDLIQFWDIVYNYKKGMEDTIPSPTYIDSAWSEIDMPRTFKDWNMPFYEGIVWLRKSVDIPAEMANKALTLNLGVPEMNYSLFVNGEELCKTVWNANPSHMYTVPAYLMKEGENVIAVRMAVLWGGGGFNRPAEDMYLTDGSTKIGLAGKWKYMKDLEPHIPKIYNYHYYPSFVFNAMVNPIIPYGIKGFLWYQGEANDTAAGHYRELFRMLINDWRIRWQQGQIPFLYVQLPNYKAIQSDPSESDWAELREAQSLALSLPNTAMAGTIDLGETENIHPLNKQDVGYRLALVAEKEVYGKDIIASGPGYKNYRIEGNEIRVLFSNTGSGLIAKEDSCLKGFAIAGKDKHFYWATARIVGKEVIVSSAMVAEPIAVRYAWADNPQCNLYNREGLPAFPFRTDDW